MAKDHENEQLMAALRGIDDDILNTIPKKLCQELIGKGLSFRQAEGLLDYAKVLLKSAKI